jgi:outer membrane protein assembly factor BamB
MRPRLRATRLTTLLAGLALLGPLALATPALASTDQDVAYQLDPAHDGYQTNDPITAPLTQVWSESFGGAVSYPLIANGVVYVTVDSTSGYGTTLYAIQQATGATLWSHALGGTYSFSGIAYDAGRVFAVDYNGLLTAFDATTGATDWSRTLTGQYAFTSPPTASGGYVYVGGAGSGGTLYAVAEASGALAWTTPVENGDDSSPAVDASGVYVGYACNQDYGFEPIDGSPLWHHSTGCEGGGGKTPVLANGDIFARDDVEGDVILSASGGSVLGGFSSRFAPAAGDGALYTATNGTLSAVSDWGLGTTAWTFAGDSQIDTAPIVVGSLVFEGSASGELYAVDPQTGATVWSTDTGHAFSAPDEQNPVPLTGLGAAEGTLIAPAGNTLMAYAGANVGSGIPANSVAPTVAAPALGAPVAADVGVWTALPTSYAYRWSLCDRAGQDCAPVTTNGTGEAYAPPAADAGDTLEVTVTATNASGTSAPVTSAASDPIPWPAPVVQSLPGISGTAVLGQTLTASTGGWANQPSAYAYQWLRCRTSCSPIADATAAAYTVAPADAGDTIEVAVTASNSAGAVTAISALTSRITMPTTLTLSSSANPSVSGATITFTATVSPDVDGGTITLTLNGSDIPDCTDVPISGLIGIQCYGPLAGAGSFTVSASYSGDPAYDASAASLTQTIESPTVTSAPAAPVSTPGPPIGAPAATTIAPAPAPAGVVIDGNPSPTNRTPTISYAETGGVTSTVCTIDGRRTACGASTAKLAKLSPGHHTFEVAVAGAGGTAHAEVSWVVRSAPPAHSAKHRRKKHRKQKPRPAKHRLRAKRRL